MLNVLFAGLKEDDYIVDVTACIYFVVMELLIYIILYVCERDGTTLQEDTVYVQSFLCLCHSLLVIFDCDGHPAECFDDVKSRDEGATIDGADYLVLIREKVGVKDNHFIEISKVNDWTSFTIVSNYEY